MVLVINAMIGMALVIKCLVKKTNVLAVCVLEKIILSVMRYC